MKSIKICPFEKRSLLLLWRKLDRKEARYPEFILSGGGSSIVGDHVVIPALLEDLNLLLEVFKVPLVIDLLDCQHAACPSLRAFIHGSIGSEACRLRLSSHITKHNQASRQYPSPSFSSMKKLSSATPSQL